MTILQTYTRTSNDCHCTCISFYNAHLYSLLTGATAHSGAYFGEGSGLIHLTDVKCSGLEYNVTECETGNVEISSNHSRDVGVKCEPGMNT